MRVLICTIALLLSWHGSVDGQVPPRNHSEQDGFVPLKASRADITLDFGSLGEYEAKQDLNETKFQRETMPYAKADDGNCSCEKEMADLQSDLMAETNERLTLKATVENFVSEMQNLQKMVYSNSSKRVTAKWEEDIKEALQKRNLSFIEGRRNVVTGRTGGRSSREQSSYTLKAPNSMASTARAYVAFSAKLSYNRELKPLDTVVFDTILTNTGSPYNAETGMFTAPLAGTYMFQATILSGYNTKVETAIIVNDKEVARIYSGAHDAHGSGSNMVIVDLRNGDTVWVRLLYQGGSHVHGYYSTFSGTLLHEEE